MAPGNRLRAYNPSTDGPTLKGNNPTRRDTTMLPAWGWLVVAYTTNNPGAWLFHCPHRLARVRGLQHTVPRAVDGHPHGHGPEHPDSQLQQLDSYYPTDPFQQDDSGI